MDSFHTMSLEASDYNNSPNTSTPFTYEPCQAVTLLHENGLSTVICVQDLSMDAACSGTVASISMCEGRASNQTAFTSSGLTATETAFGASLGTMMVMASIAIAYMWAKLLSKRTEFRRVQLELDAVRGPKFSESSSGKTDDDDLARSPEITA